MEKNYKSKEPCWDMGETRRMLCLAKKVWTESDAKNKLVSCRDGAANPWSQIQLFALLETTKAKDYLQAVVHFSNVLVF